MTTNPTPTILTKGRTEQPGDPLTREREKGPTEMTREMKRATVAPTTNQLDWKVYGEATGEYFAALDDQRKARNRVYADTPRERRNRLRRCNRRVDRAMDAYHAACDLVKES